jgi:hypothetical protein
MALIATVHHGTITLPADAGLSDGTTVRVEPFVDANGRKARAGRLRQLAKRLDELPTDLAKNHDHYLYGTPNR